MFADRIAYAQQQVSRSGGTQRLPRANDKVEFDGGGQKAARRRRRERAAAAAAADDKAVFGPASEAIYQRAMHRWMAAHSHVEKLVSLNAASKEEAGWRRLKAKSAAARSRTSPKREGSQTTRGGEQQENQEHP